MRYQAVCLALGSLVSAAALGCAGGDDGAGGQTGGSGGGTSTGTGGSAASGGAGGGTTGTGGSGGTTTGGTGGSTTGTGGGGGRATGGSGGASGTGGATGTGGSAAGGAGAGGGSGGSPGTGGRPGGIVYPADLLDLSQWKITLPIANPMEVKQPLLATFSHPMFFHLTAAKDGVVFRADGNGTTTPGSSFPRSELREMTLGGMYNASWSTTMGTHTMIVTQAVTHLPSGDMRLVAGQIHSGVDELVFVVVDRNRITLEGGGKTYGTLDAAYTLGKKFVLKIVATGGHITVFYNDLNTPKIDVPRTAVGLYFKAGVYTQSNGSGAQVYGEVVIYDLKITHI